MNPIAHDGEPLAQGVRAFYQRVLDLLQAANLPFLVGGAYALERYTGIERDTGDFDIFIRREDWPAVRQALRAAGYEAEILFPHWLAKVCSGPDYVDTIFSSGNGIARVDDEWFTCAVEDQVLDRRVPWPSCGRRRRSRSCTTRRCRRRWRASPPRSTRSWARAGWRSR